MPCDVLLTEDQPARQHHELRFVTSQYGPHFIYSGIFIDIAILEQILEI
jgi:hypothetical protein